MKWAHSNAFPTLCAFVLFDSACIAAMDDCLDRACSHTHAAVPAPIIHNSDTCEFHNTALLETVTLGAGLKKPLKV